MIKPSKQQQASEAMEDGLPGVVAGTEEQDALEQHDIAYNPTKQHLDLTKDEKRRTTALMMAIQAYKELIIKDYMYLREVADIARRNEGPAIQPATMNAIVVAACNFDMFIQGKIIGRQEQAEGQPAMTDAPTKAADAVEGRE